MYPIITIFLLLNLDQSLSLQPENPWKLIIATGFPTEASRRTEIFDLANPDNDCHVPEFPIEVEGSVTGFIGGQEYVCGGYPSTNQCYNLISGELASFKLHFPRTGASSVSSDVFYIFGGVNENEHDLNSYEVISEESHTVYDLPFTWSYGCSVWIEYDMIMLIGGLQDGIWESKTWLLNLTSKEWTQGPAMNQPRSSFGCASIKSSVVVFGDYYGTATTEILRFNEGQFSYVQDMPVDLWGMSVAEDPRDLSSLIVTGGITGGQNSNAIYKLSCGEYCEWLELQRKLNVARSSHVSMFTNKPLNCLDI